MKYSNLLLLTIICSYLLLLSCSEVNKAPANNTTTKSELPTSINKSGLKPMKSYEAFFKNLPLNEKVERLTVGFDIPDLFCDHGYDLGSVGESDGSIFGTSLSIYRLKNSKKIIAVSEETSPCQGDGTDDNYYLFNDEGFVVYASQFTGEYTPTTIRFYEKGKEVLEVIYPSLEEENSQRKIKASSSEEVLSTKTFELKIEEYRKEMKDYLTKLKAIKFTNQNIKEQIVGEAPLAEVKKEAQEFIETLTKETTKKIAYEGGYIFKKGADEYGKLLINGIDVEIRAKPDLDSPIIGLVSYYEKYIDSPRNKGAWYYIEYLDRDSGKSISGWIEGRFVGGSIVKIGE